MAQSPSRRAASKGAAKAASKPASPVIEADVDAMGDEGRAMLLAQMYSNVAEQIETLKYTQQINDLSDEDIVHGPNGPLTDQTGAPMSYGRRRQQLNDSKRRAREAGADIWPLVEQAIEKMKQQRAAQLQAT